MDVFPRSLLPHLTERVLIRSVQFKALKYYPAKNTEITVLKVVTGRDRSINKIARFILKITLKIKY